jgi:hypothetical protein
MDFEEALIFRQSHLKTMGFPWLPRPRHRQRLVESILFKTSNACDAGQRPQKMSRLVGSYPCSLWDYMG